MPRNYTATTMPLSALKPAVERYLNESNETARDLSRRAGINESTVTRLLEKDDDALVTLRVADALLCAMNCEWLWFSEPLSSFYEPQVKQYA